MGAHLGFLVVEKAGEDLPGRLWKGVEGRGRSVEGQWKASGRPVEGRGRPSEGRGRPVEGQWKVVDGQWKGSEGAERGPIIIINLAAISPTLSDSAFGSAPRLLDLRACGTPGNEAVRSSEKQ